jgi:hypothetical protein
MEEGFKGLVGDLGGRWRGWRLGLRRHAMLLSIAYSLAAGGRFRLELLVRFAPPTSGGFLQLSGKTGDHEN